MIQLIRTREFLCECVCGGVYGEHVLMWCAYVGNSGVLAEIIYFCTTTGAFKMSSVHDIGRARVYLLLYMNECMHLSVHVYVCTSE